MSGINTALEELQVVRRVINAQNNVVFRRRIEPAVFLKRRLFRRITNISPDHAARLDGRVRRLLYFLAHVGRPVVRRLRDRTVAGELPTMQ